MEGNQFDQVYHEHLSFLSVRALSALLQGTALKIHRIKQYGIHGGAIAFMRNLAQEEARQGITVNTIALGMMDTIGSGDPGLDAAARALPVGRLGTPADAGALCVYLASDEAGG